MGFIRLNLGPKLIGIMLLIGIVPTAVVAILSFTQSSTALKDLALDKVAQEAASDVSDLTTFEGQFFSDLLALADTPPVQGIIRAVDNGGIDPISNDAKEVWVNRLSQISAAMARNKGFYQQIRYIDENGDEIVRVDFKDGQAEIVSGTEQLQNISTSS